MQHRQLQLLDLPDEILLLILVYLSPEQIINVGSICIKVSQFVVKDELWRYKRLQHFPYLKYAHANTEFTQFKNEYLDEHDYLIEYLAKNEYIPKEMHSLFAFVMKGDDENLEKRLTFSDLSYSSDLLDWILRSRNQKILDIVYNKFEKHYRENNSIVINLATASSQTKYKSNHYLGYLEEDVPLLHISVLCNQNPVTINKLLETNFNSLHTAIFWHRRPLDIAARCNYSTLVECLLTDKIKFVEEAYCTAASHGNLSSMKLIHQHLKKNNSVALTQNFLNECLYQAAQNGHDETVKVLIEYGAEINHIGIFRLTSLCIAIANKHYNTVKTLLECGADTSILNDWNRDATPPILDAVYVSLDMIKLLMQFGADINAAGPSGTTALYVAVCENKEEIVKYLLDHGASVHLYRFPHEHKYSPLYMAADKGNINIIKLLIANKADVNHACQNGMTVLHKAVSCNQVNAARVILKNGADLNALYNGKTALDIAKENKYDLMTNLLTLYKNYKEGNRFIQRNKPSNHIKLSILYHNPKNRLNAKKPDVDLQNKRLKK